MITCSFSFLVSNRSSCKACYLLLFAAIIKPVNSFYNLSFVPAMKEALEKAYKAIASSVGVRHLLGCRNTIMTYFPWCHSKVLELNS